jgi:L-methionine (R)-S-oxide reductase
MNYSLLEKQLTSLIEPEQDMIANMANMSALIFQELENINWAGFYLKKGDELVLGPFQGKAACVRIPWGKGVCGTAAHTQESMLVKNVHEFPGHIACDSASNSELVVPVIYKNEVKAVFDLDSPLIGRFTDDDKQAIERLVNIFILHTHFYN